MSSGNSAERRGNLCVACNYIMFLSVLSTSLNNFNTPLSILITALGNLSTPICLLADSAIEGVYAYIYVF